MSLISQYGSFRNDLDKILLQQKELFKLSSAPLVWFLPSSQQRATDNLYGEITRKSYENGVEFRGYFENPVLVQELVRMGIDMPENIICYVDSEAMMRKFGRPIPIGTVMMVPHQRNQFYVVENSVPYHSSQRFYKYTQWSLTLNKRNLDGRALPPYLLLDDESVWSWITFEEHYGTEFLQDRHMRFEQRRHRIHGDLSFFWAEGDIYEPVDCANFNGVDNYCDLGEMFWPQSPSYAVYVFIKPLWTGMQEKYPVINLGGSMYIDVSSLAIFVGLGDIELTASARIPSESWTQIGFSFNAQNRTVTVFLNGLQVLSSQLPNLPPIDRTKKFAVGWKDGSFYAGKMSNLRIFRRSLTISEISTEYSSMLSRDFMQK